jgi:hypothetical protein
MFKQLASLALACLLIITLAPVPARAQTQAEKEARQTEKVKAKIIKLGTGKRARVEVKLKDNRRLKGYVSEIAEDHFSVADSKTGTVSTVPFNQVERVKSKDRTWIYAVALGAGTVVGLLIVVSISLRER